MKWQTFNVCTSFDEVKKVTNQLDKASLVPLKLDDGGVIKDVTNWMGVYNISEGKMCASVVPHYNLVTHKEYFNGFASAINDLGLKFEMTMSQVGNRAFADINFVDRKLEFKNLNEEFTTGLRLANSYNKQRGLIVAPRYTRLACANGMIVTRAEKTLSIKHTSKIVNEIQKFITTKLNQIIENDAELKIWVTDSIGDTIVWNEACRIIGKLFPSVKHREEILKRLNISVITVKNKKTKKKTISYVLDDNTDKKRRINRWELYNAITEYITHGKKITPHIEDHFHRNAEKLLVTPLIKMPMEKVILNA